ncbi:CotD family spore coat protein [Alkalihalobacillus sp. LMS6]|uniref:CotD family spore coat protein n=1 Tax=Alkalihalobacillus sp. LMS6 TaxID=2924034 RepID=UPI0034E968C5
MFRKPMPPRRPHVEEYVVQEIQPVLTHYVTNKVYRHVHTYPHTESTVNRELPPPPVNPQHPWKRPPR